MLDVVSLPVKSTLMMSSPPPNAEKDQVEHLFVVLTAGSVDMPEVLLVNFSKIYKYRMGQKFEYDDACVVEVGEHSFVRRRSFIAYRYAKTEQLSHLLKGINEGRFYLDEPVSDELYERILDGLYISKFLQPKYRIFHEVISGGGQKLLKELDVEEIVPSMTALTL